MGRSFTWRASLGRIIQSLGKKAMWGFLSYDQARNVNNYIDVIESEYFRVDATIATTITQTLKVP